MPMAVQPDEKVLALNQPRLINPHDAHMAAALTQPIMAAPQPLDVSGMMSGAPDEPDVPTTMAAPKPNSPASLPGIMARKQDKLMSLQEKDENPYGSANNHPGFMGKLLHGLSVATGGPNRRQFEEQGVEKDIAGLSGEQAKQGLENAQAGEAGARAHLYDQQAESGEPVEITPDMATQLGAPELAGQTIPRSAIVALSKQHGINSTKQTTTTETNQSHEKIAEGKNQTQLSVEQIREMGKVQPHITAEVNGQPHIMERDPQTHEYSIDRGIAPPNYAQMLPSVLQTKTTEVLGDDGVMHRYQYNPATRSYSDDIGAAPTGTAAHQIFQGTAIENLAPQIIADINANRQVLGNLGSYYKQWLAGTPVSDPNAAKLMGELMSFAAMQPALHAFRSTNALEAFEKLVGGLEKNPDSTIATIQGLLKTPEAFTSTPHGARPTHGPGGQPAGGSPAPPRPAGVPAGAQYITDPKTGKKGWAW